VSKKFQPKETSKVINDPIEVERLTIALAFQIERFLLGIEQSTSLILNVPYLREEYQNKIIFLNNWETLIGFSSRLRKCFDLAEKLPDYRSAAISGKESYDKFLPRLKDIRNVFEHFDEYIVGDGNNKSVDPIQAVSHGPSPSTLFYADIRIDMADLQKATQIARETFLTGYILSVLENSKYSFSTFIQRKKYEALP
jgi:hypothetical protein